MAIMEGLLPVGMIVAGITTYFVLPLVGWRWVSLWQRQFLQLGSSWFAAIFPNLRGGLRQSEDVKRQIGL